MPRKHKKHQQHTMQIKKMLKFTSTQNLNIHCPFSLSCTEVKYSVFKRRLFTKIVSVWEWRDIISQFLFKFTQWSRTSRGSLETSLDCYLGVTSHFNQGEQLSWWSVGFWVCCVVGESLALSEQILFPFTLYLTVTILWPKVGLVHGWIQLMSHFGSMI